MRASEEDFDDSILPGRQMADRNQILRCMDIDVGESTMHHPNYLVWVHMMIAKVSRGMNLHGEGKGDRGGNHHGRIVFERIWDGAPFCVMLGSPSYH